MTLERADTKIPKAVSMYSVITPVYRNAESIPLLVAEFARIGDIIQKRFGVPTEFVFVLDGSPDDSQLLLEGALPAAPFCSQLVVHARNFGSFAAIRTGLQAAKGDYFAVIAADLQEPPELIVSFFEVLTTSTHDVVVGIREARDDPFMTRFPANLFWRLYRRFVIKEVPLGGVDRFACTRQVRDELLKLEESHTSLLGQVFWLGFRRAEVGYVRRARPYGHSAWGFQKKISYLLDSVFAFTDLPIRLLTFAGLLGITWAVVFGLIIIIARLLGPFPVPGYATTMVVIMFFGALNMLGLGLIGAYTWRAYENTKRRPLSVVQSIKSFEGIGAKPVAADQDSVVRQR